MHRAHVLGISEPMLISTNDLLVYLGCRNGGLSSASLGSNTSPPASLF
jgi:hypothetical protein